MEAKMTYVQERITQALLKLMNQYPFAEITVTQVVQHAQVGRASFYRSYRSTEDVLCRYMAVLIREWGRDFEAAGDPDVIGSLLRHYYRNRDFYLLLYRCGLSHHMLAVIRGALDIGAESENGLAYRKAVFAGALFGCVEEWLRRGMAETPEQMQTFLASDPASPAP